MGEDPDMKITPLLKNLSTTYSGSKPFTPRVNGLLWSTFEERFYFGGTVQLWNTLEHFGARLPIWEKSCFADASLAEMNKMESVNLNFRGVPLFTVPGAPPRLSSPFSELKGNRGASSVFDGYSERRGRRGFEP